MKGVVLHIGNAKCGSTFLQREIFPKIDNVNFLTPDLHNVILPDNLVNSRLNIVSRENDFGSPNYRSFSYAVDKMVYLRRIVGDAKVILVVRDRTSWVSSIYNQYVRNGGTYGFQKWWNKVFDINFLDYDKNIGFLRSLFSDVLVIDFGLLKKDHYMFVKRICEFIGCNIPSYNNRVYGRSLNGYLLQVLRYGNHLLRFSNIYRSIRQKRSMRGMEGT